MSIPDAKQFEEAAKQLLADGDEIILFCKFDPQRLAARQASKVWMAAAPILLLAAVLFVFKMEALSVVLSLVALVSMFPGAPLALFKKHAERQAFIISKRCVLGFQIPHLEDPTLGAKPFVLRQLELDSITKIDLIRSDKDTDISLQSSSGKPFVLSCLLEPDKVENQLTKLLSGST